MKKSMWKKLMSTILALVMVLGLSGTLGFQHVDASEKAKLSVSVDKTEVKRGDIITYSIDLAGNETGVGLTLRMLFDKNVLEPVEGNDGIIKGNVITSAFMGDPYALKENGRFGVTVGANDPLENGNIIKAKFKVKDSASGDFKLQTLVHDLTNYKGDLLDFNYDEAPSVKVVVPATGITVDKTATTIVKGATDKLTATLVPADANGTITWSTSDSSVATVSSDSTVASVDNNGIVTAVKPGSAVITAKVGNYQATCAVTVDAPLKEIVPEKSAINMVKKQTANIAYSLVPADTTDSKDVTFTSSDETVATVNSDGKVTAKKAGQATVTITGANGIKATVTVNVSEIPVNEVVLSAQDEIIEAGAKKTITATLKPENNTDDNQDVTWTTSDEKIAKVVVDKDDSHKATIEGVAAGSAVIPATAANGTKAECTVKVPKHITSITLPETVELTRGTSTTLNVTIAPADTDDDTTVTWKSSDSDVVKVDEKTGMVYAVKAGKADVTATTKAVDNATAKPFTATTTVTVKENNMTDEIGKKLAFDEFDDVLIGQKDNADNYLNLSELIEANNITDDINVEFASSDKAVATIDNDGNVFGLKAGKTIITATVTAIAGDGSKNVYTAEGELTVKAIPLNSIAFDKVIKEMKLGATDTLSIIYNPQNTTDAKDVTWTSSNPSVISVENGKLTANAVGTADITAKVGDKTVTCTITVKEEKKAEQPKPVITNKKSDNKPATKSVSKANDAKKAKTGDNNNVVLFLVMFAAAVAMIGVITGKSLRRNRR